MASRYFPFSQEFNSDAEGWELTDTFGDRSVRIWIEILAILDRERNNWKRVEGWDSVISRKVRQSPATVSRVVGWMLAKGWLEVRQVSASGQPAVLYAPKFAKYRKTAAEPKISPNPPNPPNLTDLHQNEDPPLTPQSESAQPEGFAAFWMVYPKKIGKGDAEKAWRKIRPSASLAEVMLKAIEVQKQSEMWTKERGQYIPLPATWLRGRRWDDELIRNENNDVSQLSERTQRILKRGL